MILLLFKLFIDNSDMEEENFNLLGNTEASICQSKIKYNKVLDALKDSKSDIPEETYKQLTNYLEDVSKLLAVNNTNDTKMLNLLEILKAI